MSQKRQFKFNLTIYFYNSEDPWFEFEKILIFNQNLYSISSLVSNHQSEKLCTIQGSMRLSHCDKNNLNLRIKSWACHSWSWWKGTCPFFYNFPAQNFFSLRWRFRSSFTDILQYTQWLCLFSLFSTVRDAGIDPGPGVWSATNVPPQILWATTSPRVNKSPRKPDKYPCICSNCDRLDLCAEIQIFWDSAEFAGQWRKTILLLYSMERVGLPCTVRPV